MLEINQKQAILIITHGEKTYPEECCGILLGNIKNGKKKVLEVWATENVWDFQSAEALGISLGTRGDRFLIDPKMLLKAQKTAREKNLAIIGFYHSHPDHPAIPSETDRLLAHLEYSYVIFSIEKGKARHLGSWVLNEREEFQREELLRC